MRRSCQPARLMEEAAEARPTIDLHSNDSSSAPASTDVPSRDVNLGDRAVAAGAQLVLHLHRFDDDERLTRVRRRRPASTSTRTILPGIGAVRRCGAAPRAVRRFVAAASARRPLSPTAHRRRAVAVHRQLPGHRDRRLTVDFVAGATPLSPTSDSVCAVDSRGVNMLARPSSVTQKRRPARDRDVSVRPPTSTS